MKSSWHEESGADTVCPEDLDCPQNHVIILSKSYHHVIFIRPSYCNTIIIHADNHHLGLVQHAWDKE